MRSGNKFAVDLPVKTSNGDAWVYSAIVDCVGNRESNTYTWVSGGESLSTTVEWIAPGNLLLA